MDERPYYHAIARAARGEYHTIKRLRGTAACWKDAWQALDVGRSAVEAEKEYENLARADIRLVLNGETEYPGLLQHIAQPPFGIYVHGAMPPWHADDEPGIISIVGTRHASSEGKFLAHDFARALAAAGFRIASGLAFGIDAAAHEGCIKSGKPTIAVLAGGLDRVYPRSHETLAQQIIENGGALISEYPPGEEPFGYRFIERNRIISGLARGVLIVEAPESSGAMATARYALDQDRDVFVLPGPASSANFKGSHALIRQGAELVTSPDEILHAYDIAPGSNVLHAADALSPEETLILKALQEIGAPAEVDKISEITKMEPRIVNRALSFLVIRGSVRETDSGYTI